MEKIVRLFIEKTHLSVSQIAKATGGNPTKVKRAIGQHKQKMQTTIATRG